MNLPSAITVRDFLYELVETGSTDWIHTNWVLKYITNNMKNNGFISEEIQYLTFAYDLENTFHYVSWEHADTQDMAREKWRVYPDCIYVATYRRLL